MNATDGEGREHSKSEQLLSLVPMLSGELSGTDPNISDEEWARRERKQAIRFEGAGNLADAVYYWLRGLALTLQSQGATEVEHEARRKVYELAPRLSESEFGSVWSGILKETKRGRRGRGAKSREWQAKRLLNLIPMLSERQPGTHSELSDEQWSRREREEASKHEAMGPPEDAVYHRLRALVLTSATGKSPGLAQDDKQKIRDLAAHLTDSQFNSVWNRLLSEAAKLERRGPVHSGSPAGNGEAQTSQGSSRASAQRIAAIEKDKKVAKNAGVAVIIMGVLTAVAAILLVALLGSGVGRRAFGNLYSAGDIVFGLVAGLLLIGLGVGALCKSNVCLGVATFVTVLLIAWNVAARLALGLGTQMIFMLFLQVFLLIAMLRGFGPIRRLKAASGALST